MTDAQFAAMIGAVITAGGGFVAFCKWSVGQWLADRKEDREERKHERKEDREALRENTKAMTELSVRVVELDRKMTAIVDRFEDEVSGVHSPSEIVNRRRIL